MKRRPEEPHHDAGDLLSIHGAAPVRVVGIEHPAQLGLGRVQVLDVVGLQISVKP